MITVRDLSVKYKSRSGEILALNKVNIAMDSRELYTVIGPSGCGKSTLLHVLSGILTDFEGSVLIDGKGINPRNQRIGLVLQNYGLLPWKTVYQNVMLGLKIKQGHAVLDDYGGYLLKQLGIDDLLHRYPKELSGGQQQRVALARAFILKPDLLLMDEPFSALDAITREEVQELFLKAWQQNPVNTVFVTHSVDEALYLGRKIAVFSPSPGRILEVVDNPCFNQDNLRSRNDYVEMSIYLRNLLSRG
ncbi:MAG: ABC transporter ATP-binding protein [Syntrophomonadaceae bacterium]|nr:ABC transporter ATP-binding protein [Syntrophomonadaceae bacterium]